MVRIDAIACQEVCNQRCRTEKEMQKPEIPLPNNGYWAKVKYGKKVVEEDQLDTSKANKRRLLKLRGNSEEIALYHAGLKKIIESDIRVNLIVPDKLTNPDEMIVSAKEYFNRKDILKENKLYVRSSQMKYE